MVAAKFNDLDSYIKYKQDLNLDYVCLNIETGHINKDIRGQANTSIIMVKGHGIQLKGEFLCGFLNRHWPN